MPLLFYYPFHSIPSYNNPYPVTLYPYNLGPKIQTQTSNYHKEENPQMDFGCFKPFMENNNNTHLDYLHDNNIHQVSEGSVNAVVSGDSLYDMSSALETCYQIAGYSFYQEGSSFYNNAPTMMVQKMEDEAYNMAMVPSITPKFSFPSSSSSTVMEDQFLGFRQNNGANKMVVKAVRKNLGRSKKETNMVKGQWTLEEDRRLIKLVEKHGIRKWSHIAQMLPGRIGKQCRERWHNHLRPNIKKDSWTEDEDKVLIEAHKEVGNKWAEIAKRLPGRTENSLKNHWNTTKRRQFARRRTRTPRNSRGGATSNTILQDYIKSLGIVNNSGNMPVPLTNPAIPTPAIPVSVMPQGNGAMWKPAKMEKVEAKVDDDMIPSYDLFADMYSLLFDENDLELLPEKCGGSSSIDITGSIVFDKMDEVIMDMAWDDDVFVNAGNEIVVKKEMDLLEMISQSSGGSNCVG